MNILDFEDTEGIVDPEELSDIDLCPYCGSPECTFENPCCDEAQAGGFGW